jgi:hypothetical protein
MELRAEVITLVVMKAILIKAPTRKFSVENSDQQTP